MRSRTNVRRRPRALNADEALAELTRRYFTSHGPATVPDFVWWSGLTVKHAKTGLEMLRGALASENVDGKIYWFAPDGTRTNATIGTANRLSAAELRRVPQRAPRSKPGFRSGRLSPDDERVCWCAAPARDRRDPARRLEAGDHPTSGSNLCAPLQGAEPGRKPGIEPRGRAPRRVSEAAGRTDDRLTDRASRRVSLSAERVVPRFACRQQSKQGNCRGGRQVVTHVLEAVCPRQPCRDVRRQRCAEDSGEVERQRTARVAHRCRKQFDSTVPIGP